MNDNFSLVCDEFENFLQNFDFNIKNDFHPNLKVAFWEMLVNGGKRFRPKLLLSIVFANAKEMIKNSFQVALALESIHTYSLIHDDLPSFDNANLRRNHPTLHTKYNEALAILIGDALNTFSFYLLSISTLSHEIKIELIKELSFNAGISGMILGQALDCEFENTTLELQKLEIIHTNKTGKLIASSLKMGSIISNLDIRKQELLYNFGLTLGLYFQLLDDIIDFTKDSNEVGKTTKNDNCKNSYVNLLGLQGAKIKLKSMQEKLDSELINISRDINNETSLLLSSLIKEITIRI